jgi:exonuclease VII small subunit
LLQQQDMLRSQKSQLDNAWKVWEETEQVALEIGTKLGNNRDQIQSALKNTQFAYVGAWYTST